MRKRLVFGLFFALAMQASAQWIGRKTPGLPRLDNGAPNLNAPAPRRDGRPELSGVWQVDNLTWLQDINQHVPGGIPMTAETQALVRQRADGAHGLDEPDAHCLPQGVPKINSTPVPFEFIESPGKVVVLYEAFGQYRQIHTDGRPAIASKEAPAPAWLGYSVGRWQGDVFVVDTTGFNGRTWIDSAGHPTSEATRVTERITRKDWGHMEMEITIDDPTLYTKAFAYKQLFHLVPDTDVLEFVCLENERDLIHMRNR